MKRFAMSLSIGAVLVVAAAGSSAQTPVRARPNAAPIKPAQEMTLPERPAQFVSLERMLSSENLRAAVRLHDYAKAYKILETLTPVGGGPVDQVSCPPPMIILGGHCTLPFSVAVNPAEHQK